ncbi:Hcp family type VI secretion system effector [Aliikangiella maris]|uniref:Type VI secretion system tube protein Hcp n=2 Tax=Aliikangiella maris TaxID=3162458 RepID=A0ABV3MNC0_9GAMM
MSTEQASVYLRIDGGNVKGDVTASNYKDMIAVNSFSFSAHREINALTGVMQERTAKAAYLDEIRFQKSSDCSSTELLKKATVGKACKFEFFFTTQAEDGIKEIAKIELNDAMISSVNMETSNGGDARLFESFSVSYTEFTMTHTQYDDKNVAKAPLRFSYSGVKGEAA